MYTIEIKEWIEDEGYADKYKNWEESNRYRDNFANEPPRYKESKALSTKITDKQFEVIRKEILKEF